MKSMPHQIPAEAVEYIEKTFYFDLNAADQWDNLLKSANALDQSIQESIERFASIGVQNIRKFVNYGLEIFDICKDDWFPSQADNQSFMKNYFSILCYLVNVKESFRYQKKEISQKELGYIAQTIAKQQFLSINSSEKFVLELLLLPFAFDTLSEFQQIISQESPQIIVATKLRNIISVTQGEFFEWFRPDNEYFILMTSIITIFYFLKNSFFYTGTMKVYGYYQRLLDNLSGVVLYSIPYKNRMLLLRGSSALIAGVANIDSIQILKDRNILIEFRNGSFLDENANSRAALNAALVIHEYFAEFLVKPEAKFKLLLETTDANPQFTEYVFEQLCFLDPEYKNRVKLIPSIKLVPFFERKRYLEALDIPLSPEFRNSVIQMIRAAENKPKFKLTDRAFENVKLVTLKENETLVIEGDLAFFIYIPLEEGLEGSTMTGQQFFPKPWIPLGHIGVIQRTPRSATIVAKKSIELLMIPGATYLTYWYIDYNEKEFKEIINMGNAGFRL